MAWRATGLAPPLSEEEEGGVGRTGHPAHGCWDGRRIHWLRGRSLVESVAQLCLTLWDPTDCSPPGSSVHGILQARILEWVAMPYSRVISQARDRTQVSCIASRFLTVWVTGKAAAAGVGGAVCGGVVVSEWPKSDPVALLPETLRGPSGLWAPAAQQDCALCPLEPAGSSTMSHVLPLWLKQAHGCYSHSSLLATFFPAFSIWKRTVSVHQCLCRVFGLSASASLGCKLPDGQALASPAYHSTPSAQLRASQQEACGKYSLTPLLYLHI